MAIGGPSGHAETVIPRLLVAVVVTGALLLRPELLTDLEHSRRAWLVSVGIVLASAIVRRLVARRSVAAAPWVAAGVTLGLFAVIAAPSFRNRTLHEDFPVVLAQDVVPTPTGTVPAPPTTAPAPVPSSGPSGTPFATRSSTAVPAPTAAGPSPTLSAPPTATRPPVPSPSRSAAPTAVRLSSGQLSGLGGHHAAGTVSLYRVGKDLVLRFEDVDISGGAQPSVHLVPPGQQRPDGGVDLGALKAEHGSFSYPVPASVDPGASWTVLVWCDPYAVPIGSADLA